MKSGDLVMVTFKTALSFGYDPDHDVNDERSGKMGIVVKRYHPDSEYKMVFDTAWWSIFLNSSTSVFNEYDLTVVSAL